MQISSLPEWKLEPVRRVEPGPSVSFPHLFRAGSADQSCLAWLERNRPELEQALLRHGAVLLRGFDVSREASFESVARALSSLEARYGDLVKRQSAEFIYDATWYPKDRAILFHNEGSHTPTLPTRQFFYCSRANFTGGETPIVDCREVYRALRPELREQFESKGLLYIRNFMRGVDVGWQEFFRTKDRAEVERRCREEGVEWTWKKDGTLRIMTRVPAVIRHPVTREPSFCNQVLLHHVACLDAKTGAALRTVLEPQDLPRNVCFGDGSEIKDEVMAEVLGVIVRTAARFTWQRGDVLVLDNLSTGHARSPYDGDREILVAVGDVISRKNLN
jgi:alpha-ketoglutarate-dependent taurine dioxygenase